MKKPIITSVEIQEFEFITNDLTSDHIYEPGAVSKRKSIALKINTNIGISGEYIRRGTIGTHTVRSLIGKFVLGKNALERENIQIDLKRELRHASRLGMDIIDVALWDLAGKYYNAPIYELLGGHRKKLPCYASSFHGDHFEGGLNSPEAFADFAEQCLEMGYPAFKIHDWIDVAPKQEIAAIHALGKRVGGKMDLMLDPACSYNTFGEAWKVGRACDEEGFFWIEDLFRDGGISQFAHRKLRQLIKTPLLQAEHITSLEPKIDFLLADATDFLRIDLPYDGGITGAMKVAHAAEGLGIDVEIHAPGPAERHCMAAIRNSNYYEMALVHPKFPTNSGAPLYKCDYRDALDAIDEDGCVSVPEGPGLGVEYDWDWIAKHSTGVEEYK